MEEWQEITDFPNYGISNYGNVKNIKSGRLLTQQEKGGYKKITLRNVALKTLSIHRLVALHFIPNPENKPTVNHIDMIKDNNHFSNLEWATLSEQQQHNIKNTQPQEFGFGHARKEIIQLNLETHKTMQEFPSITLACEWLYNTDLAKFKEFNYNTLCSLRSKLLECVKGKRHSAYGFGWRFRDQTIPDEEWKEIPSQFINGSTNFYASNIGRIKSPKGKIMRQYFTEHLTVSIDKKTYYTHRLIAFAFIPNPDNKLCVYHIDGDMRNNNTLNLRWED